METASLPTPLSLLERVFGYQTFRSPQEEVINTLLSGESALVLMPTGGGKSLCYQIPALIRNGVGIVISPLIALMQDQVAALHQAGVKAACLNSMNSSQDNYQIEKGLQQGWYDLIYIAPERLLLDRTLQLLQSVDIALFAIDEAHCISQWGHDFRAEYQQLSQLAALFPSVPRIALTATADELTRQDMINCLGLQQSPVFIGSFDRPNIRYWVNESQGGDRERLVEFIDSRHRGESGIIYCLSRKRVEALAQWLVARGYDAMPYHAGLPHGVRERNQNRFIAEEGGIIVATVAFGMGIDKPNVRFVAHMNLPKNLEAYYQETGRAGRDGAPADAWMVYGLQDVTLLRSLMDTLGDETEQKRIELQKLRSMVGFCEVPHCRRQVLLAYFGQKLEQPCGNCDTCLQPPETWDGGVEAQKALSCVYRTEQRFGVYHNVDVLLGKSSDKIKQFQHDKLSTFGIGREHDASTWRSIFQQLLAAGYLTVDMERHGAVRLTAEARPILKGEETIRFRKRPPKKKASERRARGGSREAATSQARATLANLEPNEQKLFQALKSLRFNLAKELGMPPYIIFHDATLIAMAESKPHNETEMARISGVGARKLEQYGEAFLEAIQAHETSTQYDEV